MSNIVDKLGTARPLLRPQVDVPDSQPKAETRRLQLFQYSTFERLDRPSAAPVTLPDGTSIAIPPGDPTQEASLESFYAQFDGESRAQLQNAAGEMAETYYNAVVAIPSEKIKGGAGTGSLYGMMPSTNQVELQKSVSRMEDTYRTSVGNTVSADQRRQGESSPPVMGHNEMMYALTTGTSDHRNVTYGVMMAGIGTLYNQLLGFAGYVRGNVDAKKDLQADRLLVQETLDEWPDGATTQPFSWTEYTENGEVIEHVDEHLTRAEAEQLVAQLDAQIQSMDDMATLDQYHLQMMMHGYQQAQSTFSEILAVQHKTLSAMIGNLKA